MANTSGAPRTKRPEIKIAVKDYEALTAYCKGVEGATPTSVIGNLVHISFFFYARKFMTDKMR